MRLFASAASRRAPASETAPSALQVPPPLVEYHHAPFVVSAPVTATPSLAPASGSATLSTWPAGATKSTRLDTKVPTAPKGAPASSLTAPSTGVFVASSVGALFLLTV